MYAMDLWRSVPVTTSQTAHELISSSFSQLGKAILNSGRRCLVSHQVTLITLFSITVQHAQSQSRPLTAEKPVTFAHLPPTRLAYTTLQALAVRRIAEQQATFTAASEQRAGLGQQSDDCLA